MREDKVSERLSITQPTAGKSIDELCHLSILADTDPSKTRYKRYVFAEYINILNRGTELF